MSTAESNPHLEAAVDAAQPSHPSGYRPLRTWIPMVLLPLMVLMRFIPEWIPNGPSMIWMVSAFGPLLIGLVILLWWLLLSRARWYERGLGLAGVVGAVMLEQAICHSSMQGPLLMVMTIPMAIAAFAIGLVLLGSRLSIQRTVVAVLLAVLGAGVSVLLKSDGVWGNFAFGVDWRWSETSEDKLLSQRLDPSLRGEAAVAIDPAAIKTPAWPGFRGPNGDGVQRGVVFSDDWVANPPKELWRIAVGPAWSSFAVAGDYVFTQEQRGENESVVCYESNHGKQVWEQSVPSRFFEGLGGLGPRSTPSIADGAIYALGAEGWLMKLRATDGELEWKVDLREEAQRDPPMWGFSCSPFVHDGKVIVHAGGKGDKGVLAFKTEDGTLAWSIPSGEQSYGSVQRLDLLGKPYLVLLSETGAHFLDPVTGASVLDYAWAHMGYRALQPQRIDDDKVLIPTGMGTGTRLIQLSEKLSEKKEGLSEKEGQLELVGEELWTSLDMKPDFNDLLVHEGYAYGFDNTIFACIDLKDGERKWKGGRYEKGQAILLGDSGLIVVVSERGELVLLRTNPEKREELAKIPAMDGKTWNHPVVVGDKLFLRNAEEAVCYRLPTAGSLEGK